ncbi:MAG: hypothetical protein AB9869_14285 [Verrucomicrobiia bacterium]
MRWIPFLRFRFDGQQDGGTGSQADILQTPYVDFRDQLQQTLRRLLNVLAEQIPMVVQRNYRETAHGNVFTSEKAW